MNISTFQNISYLLVIHFLSFVFTPSTLCNCGLYIFAYLMFKILFPQVELGSPFPEKAAFNVIKHTECDYFYFILENESSSNNYKSTLKIGDKDLMVVETLDHDPRELGSYLDQAFLFALCLDVKARRTVSK